MENKIDIVEKLIVDELVAKAAGEPTPPEIAIFLEEEKICTCGEPLDDGGEHYSHMTQGY